MQIDLFVYSVDLHPPLGNRKGLLIRVTSETVFFAEASPLPGWSHESLEEIIDESRQLFCLESHAPCALKSALEKCTSPSLQFALESIISQIQETDRKIHELSVQGIRFKGESITEKEMLNFSTWKIKIGSLSEWASIAPAFSSALKVRLDANQNLKTIDRKFLDPYQDQIEYIEEPGEATNIETKDQIPFALDETLRKNSASSLISHRNCVAYILKPTMQGKMSCYHPFLERALTMGKKIVISSSIESPIGLYQLARLQNKISCNTPWGLGTYKMFPSDFCSPFPKLAKKGIVEFAPITWVNEKYLQKVAR